MVATREDYTQQISELDKSLKDTSSRLDVLTKSQRNGEESVYTEVDKIFQSIGQIEPIILDVHMKVLT